METVTKKTLKERNLIFFTDDSEKFQSILTPRQKSSVKYLPYRHTGVSLKLRLLFYL